MNRPYGFSAGTGAPAPGTKVKTLPPIPKPGQEARGDYVPPKPAKVKTLPPKPVQEEKKRPLSDIIHGAVQDAEHDIGMGRGKGLADVAR